MYRFCLVTRQRTILDMAKKDKKGLFSWWGRKNHTDEHSAQQEPTPEVPEAAPLAQPEEQETTAHDSAMRHDTDDALANEAIPTEAAPEVAQDTGSNDNVPATEMIPADDAAVVESQPQTAEEAQHIGLFGRLKQRLSRTRAQFGDSLVSLFHGKKIDDDLYEELETQLLIADVGVNTTNSLITTITEQASRRQLKDGEALLEVLKQQMGDLLAPVEAPLTWHKGQGTKVLLMVGVNGVGKTTTIGKLAKQYQQQGLSVMLAAGDTFRAAAVEQLQVWGERNHIPVVAQHTGADSASVIYDAFESARARHVDILIADTAGRLQNKANLMEELKKIVRVMKKIDADAPHEVMLVLDAGTGQNAISQTQLFTEAVNVSGLALTKLDGTAKGGVIFAIADQFGIPIRYIGVGEGIDDLRSFAAKPFIDALFDADIKQDS